MAIELKKDDYDEAIASIQAYAAENFDEPMGNIAAGALLDFVLAEVGPSIYNLGVKAAQERIQARAMDLDIELQEEEFPLSRRIG
ncbi:MAG: DUF2164 domain-containing protein [Bacteroidetes bacterium]|nr:DUF2164 domain-containing protein [Bacteroidota bacterium]